MDEPFYVPFEPGIGVHSVMTPKTVAVRIVDEVPDVSAVKTDAADAWFEAPDIENLTYTWTRKPADPPTRVVVMRDERYLFVAYECIEPEIAKAHRIVPRDSEKGEVEIMAGVMPRTLCYDECVGLFLDNAHAKGRYYRLQVNINGARRENQTRSGMGWTVLPASDWIDLEGLTWESEVSEGKDRWRAVIKVDMKSIGLDPEKQPTVGINFSRGRNVDRWRNYSWAEDVVHIDRVPALALGDAYLTDHGVTVTRVDWGEPRFGKNPLKLTVTGGAEDREVELKVHVVDGEDLWSSDATSGKVKLPAGAEAQVEAAWELPYNYTRITATVELVDAASGQSLYRATFPVSKHGDVRLDGKPLPNPSPDDPDFYQKKRDYVLSRLPRFCRRNTSQGAPSDFTLMSEDGKVVFNLMEAGALKRIADWICTLFEEDVDRIIAAALISHDSWVTMHASPRVPMQVHLTPLSVIRLGAGHCAGRAMGGAGIAAELPDPETGKNHEAYPALVLGHVVTAIRRRDGWTFIDPSFGHFFPSQDNTDLATADELAADGELAERVIKGSRRERNYGNTDGQIIIEPGTVVWPAGAPPK